MSGTLYSFPKQAFFGKPVTKTKLYERGKPTSRVRDLFVRQVEQIVWQYRLASDTINLPAKAGVPEIQIFGIQLKTPELHHDVLRCIDSAVQYPILFELTHGGEVNAQTQLVAAYKRPSAADASRWVLSDYFATNWLPANAPRMPMPLALDLGGLYELMLCRLLPLRARAQEPLIDLVGRIEQVSAKRREVEKIEARLAKEKQFNRKVEINTNLRQLRIELEQLSR